MIPTITFTELAVTAFAFVGLGSLFGAWLAWRVLRGGSLSPNRKGK